MDNTLDRPVVSINSLFSKYQGVFNEPLETKSRRTERGDLIEQFLNKLNPDRARVGLKPLSFAFISKFFKDRNMDTHEIYCFYKDCERAAHFSKYFWWACKAQ